MRIAEMYARQSAMLAEKNAPKEYGPLLKVAGADGGALAIEVISFADAEAKRRAELAHGTLLADAHAREEANAEEKERAEPKALA
jgi:hypothetical protein